MPHLELNNQPIYYRVFGNGNPVIFLHGFLEDQHMWDTIYPHLVEWGFKVYLLDLPCHGQSRFEGNQCSMAYMAKVVDQLCTEENIVNPCVFGHSMGGYVGLELLKLRPIQLTLIHSNFWEDPPEKKKDRNRVAAIVAENKLRLIQEAIPNLFSAENRTICKPAIDHLIATASELPKEEIIASTLGMRDRLDNANLMNENNVHIIHGELDGIVRTEKLNAAIEKLEKEPTIYRIENCGHMSIWERPEALINSLKLIVFK